MAIPTDIRPVSAHNFKIQGANNGDYPILIIPDGKAGITVTLTGTAGSAVVNLGRRVKSTGQVSAYNAATLSDELGIVAGVGTEIYAIVTSATSSTNLGIDGNVW